VHPILEGRENEEAKEGRKKVRKEQRKQGRKVEVESEGRNLERSSVSRPGASGLRW